MQRVIGSIVNVLCVAVIICGCGIKVSFPNPNLAISFGNEVMLKLANGRYEEVYSCFSDNISAQMTEADFIANIESLKETYGHIIKIEADEFIFDTAESIAAFFRVDYDENVELIYRLLIVGNEKDGYSVRLFDVRESSNVEKDFYRGHRNKIKENRIVYKIQ